MVFFQKLNRNQIQNEIDFVDIEFDFEKLLFFYEKVDEIRST